MCRLCFQIGIFGILALAISMSSGCARPNPTVSFDTRHSSQQQVTTAVDEFVECLNTLDLEKIMTLFNPACTAFLPLPEQPLRAVGKDRVKQAFADFFSQVHSTATGPRYMNLKAEEIQVHIQGHIAVATFQTKNEYVVSRRTLVFQFDNGQWQIIHLHGSNIRLDSDEPTNEQEKRT